MSLRLRELHTYLSLLDCNVSAGATLQLAFLPPAFSRIYLTNVEKQWLLHETWTEITSSLYVHKFI